ncbi:MAG: 2-amino-4-hydroxy-6-hydroxymethyldihydropteridine diphosphokinase [Candidatus Omnitrophica bacterium]|nr:2-amino-4-hydroxy-6-hydroxymethyldihydropteridine diphosphokinase [Candidatus Omnitrophota bacterium]
MTTCFIGLGSNLGDRKKNIAHAVEHLKQDPKITITKVSSAIETDAIGGPPQPKFFNAVIKIDTSYSARRLLEILQSIERKLGRQSPHQKNHPRTIDLDILLYGNLTIAENDLEIPHPRMWERKFVTVPLKEIAPEFFDKELG